MTVNANVRCVEWFDTNTVTPEGHRYVLGWYDDGIVRVVRRLDDVTWWFQSSGPGQLRQELARPTHWCEFPEGPAGSAGEATK